ncbi:MAG: hypothetical protein ACXAB4_13450 [Candidatus Hodarchaeales archaeon]|jgi:hypothetical protein
MTTAKNRKPDEKATGNKIDPYVEIAIKTLGIEPYQRDVPGARRRPSKRDSKNDIVRGEF